MPRRRGVGLDVPSWRRPARAVPGWPGTGLAVPPRHRPAQPLPRWPGTGTHRPQPRRQPYRPAAPAQPQPLLYALANRHAVATAAHAVSLPGWRGTGLAVPPRHRPAQPLPRWPGIGTHRPQPRRQPYRPAAPAQPQPLLYALAHGHAVAAAAHAVGVPGWPGT
ncbi:MAG: hypothetical protein GX161_14280 [Firmicutes bacterium]|nr:hypothetical protein [Bacillota bacterium]